MNLLHVFEVGDTVLVATFLLLAAMSFASWYIILWKLWKLRRERARLTAFRRQHMGAPDWPQRFTGQSAAGSVGVLVQELERTRPILSAYDDEARKELLSTHLAQALDVVRVWLERGLTVLASVGASAPFIGLFGTVWGVYNALMRIAAEGNASLSVVAGPMGEALVMTALGLFAAIPAVLAYNGFLRVNRVLVQDLRHVAEDMALYAGRADGVR